MIIPVVSNYQVCHVIEPTNTRPAGTSGSPKGMIFHIPVKTPDEISVLDIGFGLGELGQIIKMNNETKHWNVDGIDGLMSNCSNKSLFEKKIYRNIWLGLAQDMSIEQLQRYDVICLLDVIEHLDIETSKWLIRTLLYALKDTGYLFISTPLYFYPQDQQQDGDLEEHLIGVPASSMMALCPVMYAVNEPFCGGFIYSKKSVEYVEFFQPTANKNFNIEMGIKIAKAVGMNSKPNVVYFT